MTTNRRRMMNEREKQILKEIMKDNLSLEVDDEGEMVLKFDGEEVCKTKKPKKDEGVK